MNSKFGAQLPSIKTPPPGPHSLELASRLHAVESRNITWLSDDFPVFWDQALGSNVSDVDGNVYVDLTSAFGVAFAGHSHPDIGIAMEEQAKRLVHGMGDVHPSLAKVKLMEELGSLAPWQETRTVLASSGTEAIEIALKTAQLLTGKTGVIAFKGAYHGLTLGSLSITDRQAFRDPFVDRLSEATDFVPFPTSEDEASRLLTQIVRILSKRESSGVSVGAIVIEPIQGRGGVRIAPRGFLRGLSDLSKSAGVALIFDEIFTGLGRSGVMFESETEGVVPDLVCLGKALGGGLPLSACLGSRAAMEAWPETHGEAIHTSTFLGHPLSCTTALSFLGVLRSERLISKSVEKGQYLLASLRASLDSGRHIHEVRGRGLLVGIELRTEAGGPWKGQGARVARQALRQGLIVLPAGRHGEVVQLAPAATITEKQIDFAVTCLSDMLLRVSHS